MKAALSMLNIGVLLERQGITVPYRTPHRFCVERCGFGKTAVTVRVADGEPGMECQIDFGYLGLVADPVLAAVQAAAGADLGDRGPPGIGRHIARRLRPVTDHQQLAVLRILANPCGPRPKTAPA